MGKNWLENLSLTEQQVKEQFEAAEVARKAAAAVKATKGPTEEQRHAERQAASGHPDPYAGMTLAEIAKAQGHDYTIPTPTNDH